MLILLGVIATIITLVIVVGLHEIGHFLAARYFGVKVKRVSIGFGKPLFISKSKDNIQWVWSLWPLGGYVQLLNSRIEKVSVKEQKYCFDKKPALVRIIILLAGVVFNLIVAWLCFVLIFLIGFKQHPAIIKSTTDNVIVSTALKSQDRIINLGGKNTPSLKKLAMAMIMNLGKNNVPIVVKRDNQIIHSSIDLTKWQYKTSKNALFSGLGLDFDLSKNVREQILGVNIFKAFKNASIEVFNLLQFFMAVVKQLFTTNLPFAVLLGPLGILDAITQSFLQGVTAFLYLLAALNISVALINIFPIPGLDGGLIIYILLEKIRGKPLSVAMEVLLYRLTFIAFVLLFIQLVLNDIRHYIIH